MKDLATYVEAHTPPDNVLTWLLGGVVRFDTNARWRQRMWCADHEWQVPTRDDRCPLCIPNEEVPMKKT